MQVQPVASTVLIERVFRRCSRVKLAVSRASDIESVALKRTIVFLISRRSRIQKNFVAKSVSIESDLGERDRDIFSSFQ